MAVRICPKCDINFIRDDEQVCQICRRELKGEPETSVLADMCSSCGEHPCEAGEDLCIFCLNERKLQDAEETAEVEPLNIENDADLSIDEIDVPVTQDIPDNELRVIHEELGLDDEEDEDSEDEEEEELMEISLDDYDDGSDEDDEEDDEDY